MVLPHKINSSWIATLGNAQLLEAESALHRIFVDEEVAEKRRAGSRYTMLRGPESLVTAWHRWLLVSNATKTRGITVHRRTKSESLKIAEG